MAIDPNCPGVPGLGSFVQAGSPRRGTVVLCHGLQSVPPVSPLTYTPDTVTLFQSYETTLANNLLADGWSILNISYPEDATNIASPCQALATMVNGDIGVGAAYLQTTQNLYGQVFPWCAKHSPGPVLFIGISGGGWHALVAGAFLSSQIVGAIAHIPATIWETLNPAFTPPRTYAQFNFQGMDAQPSWLNNCTAPLLYSYGTNDVAVGYDGTNTIAAGSAGVDVTTLAGSTTVLVNSPPTNAVVNGSSFRVLTTQGFAFFTCSGTGTSPNELTGCQWIAGTGLLISGAPIVQSNSAGIITAAQAAGAPVTANVTANNHELRLADAGTYYNAAGPTALSSFIGATNMPYFNPFNTTIPDFVSAKTAILGSDGVWHIMTFSTINNSGAFVGVSISSPGSATVSQGSPICAIPVSGSRQSFPYWIRTVIDPNAPAIH